jgi:hypothetical protein
MNRKSFISAVLSIAPLFLVAACSGAPDGTGSTDSTEADLKAKVCGGMAGLTCPDGYSCEFPKSHIPDQTGTCKKTPAQHTCGGIAGLACPSGYACEMSEPHYPDQSGTCAKDPTGQTCGGFGGIACPSGFVCEMSLPLHPDQSGTCASK